MFCGGTLTNRTRQARRHGSSLVGAVWECLPQTFAWEGPAENSNTCASPLRSSVGRPFPAHPSDVSLHEISALSAHWTNLPRSSDARMPQIVVESPERARQEFDEGASAAPHGGFPQFPQRGGG